MWLGSDGTMTAGLERGSRPAAAKVAILGEGCSSPQQKKHAGRRPPNLSMKMTCATDGVADERKQMRLVPWPRG